MSLREENRLADLLEEKPEFVIVDGIITHFESEPYPLDSHTPEKNARSYDAEISFPKGIISLWRIFVSDTDGNLGAYQGKPEFKVGDHVQVIRFLRTNVDRNSKRDTSAHRFFDDESEDYIIIDTNLIIHPLSSR